MIDHPRLKVWRVPENEDRPPTEYLPLVPDPRPDLPGADEWARVLDVAAALDYQDDPALRADEDRPVDKTGTLGFLVGLRAMGARLVSRGERYELRNGQIPADEWHRLAGQWYEPRRALITRILTAAKT